jgi:hypothetical protein
VTWNLITGLLYLHRRCTTMLNTDMNCIQVTIWVTSRLHVSTLSDYHNIYKYSQCDCHNYISDTYIQVWLKYTTNPVQRLKLNHIKLRLLSCYLYIAYNMNSISIKIDLRKTAWRRGLYRTRSGKDPEAVFVETVVDILVSKQRGICDQKSNYQLLTEYVIPCSQYLYKCFTTTIKRMT